MVLRGLRQRGISVPMRLEFRANPNLPRLAWAVQVHAGSDVAVVHHGPRVETWARGFVEGAWDARFADRGFDRAAVLAGSGGRLAGAGLRLATPTHLYERLQSLRVGDELLVSNSLAFLLALSGDRLDPDHPHYYLDLLGHHRSGIRDPHKRLRLAAGRFVDLHDACNLDVGADLDLQRREKPWGSPPESCDDYIALLEETVGRVVDNADDSHRRWRYRPVAMVSQGYDSTAVAALARKAGCREAATFLCSDSEDGYVDDRGDAVATALDFARLEVYERNDAPLCADFREEEFYLEPWGVDRGMAVMAAQLEGALLLSGRSAEPVWTRGLPRRWGLPDLQHRLNITPGCALGELRLRTGFLHFAPATIALVHAPVIHAWHASRELRPWSIGGDYDKPIARRIAEEAGVPRELFGWRKKGGPERLDSDEADPWPPWVRGRMLHAALRRVLGHRRTHPRWRLGSFEIQRGAERMIERYRAAIDRT